MTNVAPRLGFDSTSAGGAMRKFQASIVVAVGCFSAAPGTSAGGTTYPGQGFTGWPSQESVGQTTVGASIAFTISSGAAIGELRRLSGLNWDQLARMFGVSRRSLHFWASGKTMARHNEEHLARLLAVVRKLDRGSASENRTLLLAEIEEDGRLAFDLLAAGDYDRVLTLLGPGSGRKAVPPARLSPEARAAREPRPPEELVGALQDRIHPTSGRLLAAKPIATNRKG